MLRLVVHNSFIQGNISGMLRSAGDESEIITAAAPIHLSISGDYSGHIYLQEAPPGPLAWIPSLDCEHAVLFTRVNCTMVIAPKELTAYRLFATMFARGVRHYQFACEASNVL